MKVLKRSAVRSWVLFGVLSVLSGLSALAQSSWSRTYGGAVQDRFYQILPAPDGAYLVPGTFVNDSGNWDARLVRLAPTGDVLGAIAAGGPGDDIPYRMTLSSDGDYLLGGITNSSGAGGDDIWLVKLDANGDPVWQRTYGQAGDQDLEAVLATPDGGAIIAADATLQGQGRDAWLFRVDASGSIVWSKTIGGAASDYPRALVKVPNGGFAMVGTSLSAGPVSQGWLVGFSMDGTLESQSVFGLPESNVSGQDVAAASDGDFFILGSSYEPAGTGAQVFILKMSAEGTVRWQESIGGSDTDEGYRVVPDSEGGCFVVGRTGSFPGGGNTSDGWAAHLSGTGQILWQQRYGEEAYDALYDAVLTPDGSLLLAGTKAYDGPGLGEGWLLKVNASDGSMDASCALANPTSFPVTALSAGPADTSMSLVVYPVQTMEPSLRGTEISLPSMVQCSSALNCTLDGSASGPAHAGVGVPAAFHATATATDCPALPSYAWTFGDGGTSALQNPAHAYTSAGTFHWSVAMSTEGQSIARSGDVIVVPPPVVTSLKKVAPPFSIVVTGGNFQQGIQVFIDGVPWSAVLVKKPGKLKLTGGASLKAAVPKGVARTFRFLNPDGGEATRTWSW